MGICSRGRGSKEAPPQRKCHFLKALAQNSLNLPQPGPSSIAASRLCSMKSILSFFAGCLVGAAVIWFGLARQIMLVPSGTTLVEVNRFNGTAHEVYYSYEEASRLRHEEEAKMETLEAVWEKERAAAQPSEPVTDQKSEPAPEPKRAEPPELTAEELAQVKFIGKMQEASTYLTYQVYNGTDKVLKQAHVRIEGMDKTSGLPIGRSVIMDLNLQPASDIKSSVEVRDGMIPQASVAELKITLVKAIAAAANAP